MPVRLFRLYQRRRIVNINANIVAAGFLAMLLALVPVHFSYLVTEDKLAITIIGVVADIVFDVAIYYALHWVANHWKPIRPRNEADRAFHDSKPRPFMKDASIVQFERALLSPLFYGISAFTNYRLQVVDVHRTWAFAIGIAVGLLVTRCLHTMWGIRSGRFRDLHDGG